jgi:hypothetical protein
VGDEIDRIDSVVVCSAEEITHKVLEYMICDVHFGDTRNELTPARYKWLSNNHSEEQTTTSTYTKDVNQIDTMHNNPIPPPPSPPLPHRVKIRPNFYVVEGTTNQEIEHYLRNMIMSCLEARADRRFIR